MTSMSDALATIPVVQVPAGGLVQYAIDGRERMRALRDDCVAWLPRPASSLLPAIDGVTRRWLKRSRSPYIAEVETIAAVLGFPGVWFLNGCYQWGCTAVAREQGGALWLARTLDWPFPGLGRHLEVARMRGAAGAFDNVTWPGYVGCLTASAPGRFAAAINQAPLRRRTRHAWLRAGDVALNALRTRRIRFIPPDHLLREVVETAATFADARRRLETTPVARPVIYTLVGCRSGERCVIERTEESFTTREEDTAAANDWLRHSPLWEARVSSEAMFTRSYDEAAQKSRARREQLAAWSAPFASGNFEWVTPPVLNGNTRLAVEMCPASGALRAVGYELMAGSELPQRVTLTCELAPAA
ncbi:MAG: hypothetical protein QOC56_2247 [Alphaproteobacteria bacterium]|nr:hypothetical protein [Alphaproteobacteria bacterium]